MRVRWRRRAHRLGCRVLLSKSVKSFMGRLALTISPSQGTRKKKKKLTYYFFYFFGGQYDEPIGAIFGSRLVNIECLEKSVMARMCNARGDSALATRPVLCPAQIAFLRQAVFSAFSFALPIKNNSMNDKADLCVGFHVFE